MAMWRRPLGPLSSRRYSGHLLRWRSLALGALTFMAAHSLEVVMWTSWFGATWHPFFMNSGQAVAFTSGCFLIGGLLASVVATDHQDALIHAGNVTAGGGVALIFVIFRDAPGALSPIAILIGIHVLGLPTYLGALITVALKAQAADRNQQPS
jgi:hypothetical protein